MNDHSKQTAQEGRYGSRASLAHDAANQVLKNTKGSRTLAARLLARTADPAFQARVVARCEVEALRVAGRLCECTAVFRGGFQKKTLFGMLQGA